jgi:hypothetical protein
MMASTAFKRSNSGHILDVTGILREKALTHQILIVKEFIRPRRSCGPWRGFEAVVSWNY